MFNLRLYLPTFKSCKGQDTTFVFILLFHMFAAGLILFFSVVFSQVEAILVNIFGGIVNCAIIANGITKACRELELKVPLVVRLEGKRARHARPQ